MNGLALCVLLAASACTLIGRSGTVDVSTLTLHDGPSNPHRHSTPVVIVIGDVPATTKTEGDLGIQLVAVKAFVSDHLARALRRQFATVEVIDASAARPRFSHVELNVNLTRFWVENWRRAEVDPAGTVHVGVDWSTTWAYGSNTRSFKDRTFGESGLSSEYVVATALEGITTAILNQFTGWGIAAGVD